MTKEEKRKEWEQRIAELEASGKSVRAFCIENGLRESQVHYWRKRLRGSQTDSNVRWISVELDGSFGENSDRLNIRVGRAIVEVQPGFDKALLSDIVRTLMELC